MSNVYTSEAKIILDGLGADEIFTQIKKIEEKMISNKKIGQQKVKY